MLFLPPPDPGIEFIIASKGMSKGLSQTEGIQVVGRAELAFGPIFVAALAKNLTSPSTEGELQFSAGGRLKLGGMDVAVSAALKKWVDTTGSPDAEAAELGLSVSRTIGSVTPKVQLIYSPDDLGPTTYSIYAEGGIAWKLGRGLQLSANIGRRDRGKGLNYTAANIGIAYSPHRNFSGELRLYDTSKSDVAEPYKRRLVASLKAKF